MSTTITLNSNRFALIQKESPEYNDHSSSVLTTPFSGEFNALFGFEALPKEYYHRLVEHVYLRAYIPATDYGSIYFDAILNAWDEKSVTWYNKPGTSYTNTAYAVIISNNGASIGYSSFSEFGKYGRIVSAILNGVATSERDAIGMHTSYSANPPQLQVIFGDEFKYLEIQSTSPGAGAKVDRKKDLTISFSATVLPTYGSYVYQLWYKQCKLYWRQAGAAVWNEIPQATSTGTKSGQFTIPANTFPSGNIEYYIKTVDSSDHESTSQVVTIDTTDTLSSAICVSPSGTVIDGNSESTFSWQHINQSGSAQTKADIEVSQDGNTWASLGTVYGSSNTFHAAAGQMSSGTWYWRVRTYNNDNQAGAWSSPAQFIALSSPPTPAVLITDTSPRPSIQWQTTEQEAYQLRIAGIIDQTYYGTERQWHSPFYLPDGEYTIEIRTQSRYGMWSAWGSTALIVQNTPGPEIELSLISGNSVVLSWQGSYDFYLVYRNGVPIARVQDDVYVDDLSVGSTSYQIRGCYKESNNYGLSPVVDAYVCPSHPIIKALGSLEWQELKYSTEQHQVFKADYSRDMQSSYMAGRKFPMSEASEFYSYTLSFSCAFPADKRPIALESMVGHIVCVKTPNAEMVIGSLPSLPKRTNDFHIEYSISVNNEQHEEEIDIDTGTVL